VLNKKLANTLGRAIALALMTAATAQAAETETKTMSTIRVEEDEEQGTAVAGYRSKRAEQIGPLGEISIEDAPFSIAVVPHELIENLQATKPDDLFKIHPATQLSSPQSRFFTGVTVRGFGLASTKRIDNVPSTSSYVNVDLEDKERVEILSGLSGFLYGSGNVGGTLNYVLKRPTGDRFNSLTAGINDGSSLYAHGDFGGPIGDGQFGYRINVAGQDGDTSVDHRSIERTLFSGAFDWNITDTATLTLDASSSDYEMQGTEPFWATSGGARFPGAPDPDDYYGQPYTRTKTHQDHIGVGFKWQINDVFSVRSNLARRESEIELIAANNTLVPGPSGNYNVQSSEWEYPDVEATGGYFFADAKFSTGPIEHGLTFGYYGDTDERTNFRSSAGGWATLTSTAINLSNPVYFTTRPTAATGPKYIAQKSEYRNIVIGDDIHFNEQWSALVGFNHTAIVDKTYGATGAVTADYDDSDVTPTVSLMFKPLQNLSLYTSYIESLEKGGVAGLTFNNVPVVNASEVMPPLMSEQIEVGAKMTLGGTLLTAALFQIDKGLQYYDVTTPTAPVYVQDGRQVHEGFEFTATGRVTQQLTVIGGLTLLDAKVKENHQSPQLEGKTPINVAETVAKIYVEYDLAAVPGLTLIGGVFYTGDQQVDTLNTYTLPSFTTGDIGARYVTEVATLPLTLRLNVANITNEAYWMSTQYTGTPRTLSASAQIMF
jgi:iron complex outermembrane receptor protein